MLCLMNVNKKSGAHNELLSSQLGILPQDIRALETKLSNGGGISTVHSPQDAADWIETHYEDDLLKAMRGYGIGGPIAVMLSPESPALAIFGSVSDGWVNQASKVLSDISQLAVMIQPLEDDPTKKWDTLTSSKHIRSHEKDIDRDEHHDPDDKGKEEEEGEGDEIGWYEDESDRATDVEVTSPHDGNFRPRGGAEPAEKYISQNGPVHNLDVELELYQKPKAKSHARAKADNRRPVKVSILCKIQFTIQSKYTDHQFNGYRPQAISRTNLIVEPVGQDIQVFCDRSYGSIGFLVHEGKYIERLPCEGFIPPEYTVKTVKTKTRGLTGTALVTAGLNPTGGVSVAANLIHADATENQNDRVAESPWSDPSLKAKERICELTTKPQKVVFVGDSLAELPKTDTTTPKYPAATSLSAGPPPTMAKPTILKKIKNWLAVKLLTHKKEEPPDSWILDLPIHDFKSRGWDVMTEKWRMPVYPSLDHTLQQAVEDSKAHVWKLKMIDLSSVTMPQAKGKEHNPVPTIIAPGKGKETYIGAKTGVDMQDTSSVAGTSLPPSLEVTTPLTEGFQGSSSTSFGTHALAVKAESPAKEFNVAIAGPST
ncbi:hypothetical protein B0H19DRAFT_1075701 [Mycena capillaripes]|nr:hypothetical protein B0H19DRAFT_1075701 [Mycena capillaripes]